MQRWTGRCVLIVLLTLAISLRASADEPIARIDRALHAARTYLLQHQSPDGAWRSQRYGFLKDGPSLTPHVAWSLHLLAAEDAKSSVASERARVYLQTLIDAGDQLRGDLSLVYPTYTAAGALRLAAARPCGPDTPEARAWAKILLGHQLNESLGWKSSDLEFGGWSYAVAPPRRPQAGRGRGPWDWSNLSATVDALEALRESHASGMDQVVSDALVLVRRCQNLSVDGSAVDARFDDGGFFFTPVEGLRNKAGAAGCDSSGRERFRSYGSATADGISVLLLCGVPPADQRIIAARKWLSDHFSTEHVPGDFVAANQDIRDATYFYYCRSATKVMDGQPIALAFVDAITQRQRADGSWSNPCSDGREDDPLIATPLAIQAMLHCRAKVLADSN